MLLETFIVHVVRAILLKDESKKVSMCLTSTNCF